MPFLENHGVQNNGRFCEPIIASCKNYLLDIQSMKKAVSSLLIVVFLFCSLSAYACDKKDGGIFCRESAWDNLSSAVISFPDHQNTKYNFDFGKNVIQISAHADKNVYQFILIEPGIYMYPKKLPVIDHPFEPFEGFMGQIRIITFLLNSAFPNGPASIQRKEAIKLGSQTEGIKIVTDPATVSLWGAPWSATGSIENINQNQYRVSLVVIFQDYYTKNVVTQMLNGDLDYSNTTFKLPDSFKLEKYHVISLSDSKDLSNIKSIGELNKYLNKHEN